MALVTTLKGWWGLVVLMSLISQEPQGWSVKGGVLPRLPPALHHCSQGSLGSPSLFCCIPLLVFLGGEGTGCHLALCPRGWQCGMGGAILLCIVLLSLMCFLLPGLGNVCQLQPATLQRGEGINKVDGREPLLSLHGLASLLSSVRRLCEQVSEVAQWEGPGPPLSP